MSAARSVARHLSVIFYCVEVCACPELLLGSSGGFGRKSEVIQPLLYWQMPNPAIRFGDLTILKFPSIVTTIPTGNFESEHVCARVSPCPGCRIRHYQLDVTQWRCDYDANRGKSRIDTNQCIDSKNIDWIY